MKIIVALLALTLTSCVVQQDTAEQVLKGAGYTNIVLGGPNIFLCREDEEFSRTFKAIGPSGVQVEGVICSTFFVNSIRITN